MNTQSGRVLYYFYNIPLGPECQIIFPRRNLIIAFVLDGKLLVTKNIFKKIRDGIEVVPIQSIVQIPSSFTIGGKSFGKEFLQIFAHFYSFYDPFFLSPRTSNVHTGYVAACLDVNVRYLFQQISKFLKDSMDVFYGTRTLKSIDYSKNN